MLYQSLIVNVLYYGAAFALYLTGVYTTTLKTIALMFGVGMAIDSVITLSYSVIIARKTRRDSSIYGRHTKSFGSTDF